MRSLLKSLGVLLKRILTRNVHFPKEYAGRVFSMEDGKKFRVIRDIKVETDQTSGKSPAVFCVRFRFSGLPLAVNKRISIFPAPFLLANPGFLQKIWTVTEDGWFQGIYQWESRESAETYPQSFIFKMMTKRSAGDILSFEVIPDTVMAEYIEKLFEKVEIKEYVIKKNDHDGRKIK